MTGFTNINTLPISSPRPSDVILDVVGLMCVTAQALSEGQITDRQAEELSWLLGSFKKRLEPLSELLDALERAGTIEISPEAYRMAPTAVADLDRSSRNELAIADGISGVRLGLKKIRKGGNA